MAETKFFEGYNDLELLFLIHDGNEWALNVFIKKYQPMICRIIRKFHIPFEYHEDMIQEASFLLLKAIDGFNPEYGKTFYKYFECILIREFVRLTKKIDYSPIYCDYEMVPSDVNILNDLVLSYGRKELLDRLNSDIERIIYERYFVLNQSISMIEKETNYSKKQVYNAISRIRSKLK